MQRILRVSKEDSYDLGFVDDCLLSAAINQEEFRRWIYWVIEHTDTELPTFFELDILEERVGSLYKTTGFIPDSKLSDSESHAIYGIAYKRGAYDPTPSHDVIIGRNEATKALLENPHIEQRFR